MPDGRVAYARNRVVIDEDFVAVAKQGDAAEKRFRFSSLCVEKGCAQWDGSKCGVIEKLLDLAPDLGDVLPECSIREECRWFEQRGAEACRVCPYVITDST